ncbi:MAG: 5-dehydro-4-deoxy-D-glucuronate isomerase [Negativicutes bacterium]|nr:5-dehydro-4-deoxy-D-glucuronate isomerase [Negativicutes bacterium]
MEIRCAANPQDVKHYDTDRLRQDFLIETLFLKDAVQTIYSHIDRMIVGGAFPCERLLLLEAGKEICASYFLERRELGIINIGGRGIVTLDGVAHELEPRDGLYVGKGVKEVLFASANSANPAKFYFNSAPAHLAYPTVKINVGKARKVTLGSVEEANQRTIFQYVHPKVLSSCQLVMGMTILANGSVWNTLPVHTHDRRMEVYLYLDVAENAVVFHYMGEPQETRHIVVRNEQAVISPSWSIHAGVGTRSYSFIWGMAGENQTFNDMDVVAMPELR